MSSDHDNPAQAKSSGSAVARFVVLRVVLPLLAAAMVYVAVRYGMIALAIGRTLADLGAAILAVVVAMATLGGVARGGVPGYGSHGIGMGGGHAGVSDGGDVGGGDSDSGGDS